MNLEKLLSPDWNNILKKYLPQDWFENQNNFLHEECENYTIYPAKENIFNAFNTTHFSDVKVVIFGQDPYHGENQAHGLSFSVDYSQKKLPPSLRNIFKEMESDLGIDHLNNLNHGCLQKWAEQGVLLINAVLTVRAKNANSHAKCGWEIFTDSVIEALNKEEHQKVVFVLWGAYAQAKKKLIDESKHLIIESAHPSPLSAHRGFFGSKVFSRINEKLIKHHLEPIDWQLQNYTDGGNLYVQDKLF